MAKIASKQAKIAKPKAVQAGRVKSFHWPSSKSKTVVKKIKIEYDFSKIKMGLIDMVDRDFCRNLNNIAVRASKVAVLGSLNVYYEFQRTFNDDGFDRVERLAADIVPRPGNFFNGVRVRDKSVVNTNNHTRMADEYFIRYGIEKQPPEGMAQKKFHELHPTICA